MENIQENVKPSHPYLGLLLSVLSAILVGSSYIFQKKGLLKSTAKLSKNDKHKGFGYLQQWLWWLGLFCMASGEIINFIAYTIAPAILITPLGALRVIVSAILSAIFLKEHLNKLRKSGIMLSLVGSTMIVLHAPKEERVTTFVGLVEGFSDIWFILYCSILLFVSVFLMVIVAPRRGHRDIMVYLSICTIIGALTVLCGKGLGMSLKDTFAGVDPKPYFHPLFWLLIFGNIVGVPIQIIYINKALALFDTSAVTPIQYVFTNLFLIVGSIMLFQESMKFLDGVGFGCGFITIAVGVLLINSNKESSLRSSYISDS